MARILVIDDDESVRDVLECVLTAGGYDVRTAPDGASGIALAAQDAPDLAVVDFAMPGLGGAEVLRALKSMDAALPVFFLTAYGDFPDRPAFDEADCCFVKSSDLAPMLEAIARALGREPSPCKGRPGRSKMECVSAFDHRAASSLRTQAS